MKSKAIMVLGTGSDVGKSLISAGLCRILSDWGLKVAPFKAQNMSNNSFVTEDGGEIGRAQAVQAECARVKATVDMNPVLLKPAEDNLSQVVVLGKSIGHFPARAYFGEKEKIWATVCEAYERLSAEYEVIVMEGAGSCAELNLKGNDFVNFRSAEMANAPCVLVGDIDRGGIFASLIGTLDLLSISERDRVVGLIVNKFRGDRSLFDAGVKILEERSSKKVWGVLPYDRSLWIESEDAVCLESQLDHRWSNSTDLDIAVILLPRMSNFTDFEVLAREPGVSLRYVKNSSELGNPDLLILPGTKATVADLNHLRKTGLEKKILNYFEGGGRILGICGGWQMLGKTIIDKSAVESKQQMTRGLGLFEMETKFFGEKILRQVKIEVGTRHLPAGRQGAVSLPLFGEEIKGVIDAYEIHMGKSQFRQAYIPFGEGGAVHPNGRAAGTYFHGLFDSASFRQSFLNGLRKNVGKERNEDSKQAVLSAQELKEQNFNRLANLLRENLDLNWLRENVGVTMPELH